MTSEILQDFESDEYNVQPKTYISEAVVWAAKQGNLDAMYVMGLFFLGYYKCIPDHKKAFYWLKKAAFQHQCDATFQVGHCYEYGIGVTPDKTEAIRWYHEAGRLHYYLAEKKLAFCYSAGKLGCYPDINNAEKWHNLYMNNSQKEFFENNEKWNIPQELQDAGYTFESKIFKGEKCLVNAVKFGVDHDNIISKYCLGLLYTSGFGGDDILEKDKTKAIKIFEELIYRFKHPESMYCLARLYEEDDSQPRYYYALKLYKVAARHGEEAAKQVLLELRSMPMDDESKAFRNEINKRYHQKEYLKYQQSEMNYKKNHSVKTKVKTILTMKKK